MKKITSVLLIVLILSQLFTIPAFAAGGAPVGGCLPGYELHPFMEHSGDMHHHIGINNDTNGDGYICMRMLSEDLHLHIDNTIPLG